MTSARPRRPLPARVYWFRRAVVVSVALAMVFGVAQLLGRTVADDPDQARTVSATPGASSSPESRTSPSARPTAPTPTVEASASAGKKGKQKREPLAEPTGPCDPEEIVAEPTLDGPAIGGRTVRFTLELTTLETPACTWTASASTLVVSLFSDRGRVWSSQDCEDAVEGGPVVVRQAVPATVAVAWRGRHSDEGCTNLAAWALPGSYQITAAAYVGEPTSLQFELERPMPPTITSDPKTKARPDGAEAEEEPKNKKKKRQQEEGR